MPSPDNRAYPQLDFFKVRGAVARVMAETHPDWFEAVEQDLAELLEIAPGVEPFTWNWGDYVAEGLP
jgi:hypothetical protein